MNPYICIHGHFYQPPRENPWLEEIERQDSAYPHHDWNERISAECYQANAASRILNDEGRITRIVNNYSKISFDFGPTLLTWLERKAPFVHAAILEADKKSAQRFGGHGSAMAQPYHHAIMPLANSRDKFTQIHWGIIDFRRRFGREPEGMWLPETAVDLETLDLMARAGIRFTILAPHQARRYRRIGQSEWTELDARAGGRGRAIDTRRAYRQMLPDGRHIDLFFYADAASRAVAFDHVLQRGEDFVATLYGIDGGNRDRPRLLNIATDGETYGHHRRFADMALAYAITYIEAHPDVELTNYAQFLELHPPEREVEIAEATSWSCVHGIERWKSDCGCNTGARPEWRQHWRAPLREALDGLRDAVAPLYEKAAAPLLRDPWGARDAYIDVLLDDDAAARERFLAEQADRPLDAEERVRALELLELQRNAMLMYTSCGWFFDDLAGIETVQVLRYAGRVAQIAEESFGGRVEAKLLAGLRRARSNDPAAGDGREIYERQVRAAKVDLAKVAAHHVVQSVFETCDVGGRIYGFDYQCDEMKTLTNGRAKWVVGWGRFAARATGESATYTFGALHLGDHNLFAGVREYLGEEAYRLLVQETSRAFERFDVAGLVRLLDRHFGGATYSIKSLFRDEQRRVVEKILDGTLRDLEEQYRGQYERNASMMEFLAELGMPQPRALLMAAEFTINTRLRRELERESPDVAQIDRLLAAAARERIALDGPGLAHALENTLSRLARRLTKSPEDYALLGRIRDDVALVARLPFHVNLWELQNAYYRVWRALYRDTPPPEKESAKSEESRNRLMSLGEDLSFRLE